MTERQLLIRIFAIKSGEYEMETTKPDEEPSSLFVSLTDTSVFLSRIHTRTHARTHTRTLTNPAQIPTRFSK